MKKSVLLLLAICFLAACSDPDKMVSLVKEIDQTISRTPASQFEKLPSLEQHKMIAMPITQLRNPFETPTSLRARSLSKSQESSDEYKPDVDRKKSTLEQVLLKNLHFVGVIEQGGRIWAIINNIVTDQSNIVKVGDYLGESYGRIMSISSHQLILDERKQSKNGEWKKVKTVMKLQN